MSHPGIIHGLLQLPLSSDFCLAHNSILKYPSVPTALNSGVLAFFAHEVRCVMCCCWGRCCRRTTETELPLLPTPCHLEEMFCFVISSHTIVYHNDKTGLSWKWSSTVLWNSQLQSAHCGLRRDTSSLGCWSEALCDDFFMPKQFLMLWNYYEPDQI